MKFLPYQKKWIEDKSRLKILEKSRRIGGTYSTSYGVFRDLMEKKGTDIIVVSRDESLSTEFVMNVTRWFRMWNAIRPREVIAEKNFKRLSITVPHSGGESRLIAVSSNPNASAGKGGCLVIDELALHKDPDMLMTVAQPVIMAGGNLSVLSTHRSRNSRFNTLVQEARKEGSEWSLHSTTIIDAIEQGLVEQIVNPTMEKIGNDPWKTREDFLNWLKSTYDEFTFAQEFMCIPADDACSLLSYKEIDDAKKKLNEEGSKKEGIYYLGYDSAESLHGDHAAISVIRATIKDVELVEQYYFPRGTPIAEQLDTVVAYAKKYKVDKVVSDNAGIGRHPTTILKGRLGDHRVVAFDPTMKSKEEMCVKVKRYFQNGWVRMPGEKKVEDDFLSIDRVITTSGNIVYQAVRQNHTHGDMFSATAMAMTQVPEETMNDISGVKASSPEAFDSVMNESGHMSIRERIKRNRKLDAREKKRFTY